VSKTFSDSHGHVERARRYRLQLELEYHGGTREWRQGRTHDISSSGVLFDIKPEESVALRVNAPIEATLMLPADRHGIVVSRVVCTGRIARIVPGGPGGRAQVAATIDRYRLERAGPVESHR
jgi:hypothetical protein